MGRDPVNRLTRALAAVGAVATTLFAQGPSASAGFVCNATFHVATSPSAPSGDTYLQDVDASSPSVAWAVGQGNDRGFSMRWNGAAWTAVPVPAVGSGEALAAVAVLAPHDVWAAGEYSNSHGKGRSLLLHRRKGGWVHIASPNPSTVDNELYELSPVAPNDIWTAGTTKIGGVIHGLVAHWNGTKWKRVPFPVVGTGDNYVEGLAAAGKNDVWIAIQFVGSASGHDRLATFHRVGAAWHRVPISQPTSGKVEPRSLLALSSDSVWLTGFYDDGATTPGLFEHWDGIHWVQFAGVDPSNSVFMEALAALGPHSVYAFGDYHHGSRFDTLVERFTGTSWHRVTSSNPGTSGINELFGGAAAAAGSQKRVWAVGLAEPGGTTEQALVEQACP